jgi:phosphosulfolactate phosphohydrolase-like enzyme
MGCAWTAAALLRHGFEAETDETAAQIEQWRDTAPEHIRGGRSADYLRRTGQTYDLEFIINHIDDLDVVPVLRDHQLLNAVTVS